MLLHPSSREVGLHFGRPYVTGIITVNGKTVNPIDVHSSLKAAKQIARAVNNTIGLLVCRDRDVEYKSPDLCCGLILIG